MQIWLYKRLPQRGDYVYADGHISDSYNPTKTVVGIVFYIFPSDKEHGLMVCPHNLQEVCFGLSKQSWNEITLKDRPEYDVFDIPTLQNKGINLDGGWSITSDNYKDSLNGDEEGFRIFTEEGLAELGLVELDFNFGEYKSGTLLPWGLVNTLKIIRHRNIILSDSGIDLQIPVKSSNQSEAESLTELIDKLVLSNGNNSAYSEYYFPAASECYAYEPTVKNDEILDDRFKVHRWFLPSFGELARVAWYQSQGFDTSNQEAIFANAYQKGFYGTMNLGYTQSNYHSSTEYSSSQECVIGISYSNTVAKDALAKQGLRPVRPVCTF